MIEMLKRNFSKVLVWSLMVSAMLTVMVAPSFAQSLTLDIDVQPLFDGITQFFPVAMAVFGVIGGLMIAFTLAKYLVNAFKNAFEGKSI